MYCQILVVGLLSFGFAFLGRAYIIDDTNSTIQYSGAVHVLQYLYDPDHNLDNNRVYKATYSDIECRTEDNCHMKIPFTGTGITLYALLWGAVNVTFAIDGGSPQPYFNNSCSYPYNPCYNVSTVDFRSLAYGDHIVDVAVFSNYSVASDYNFDYAVINDTKPAIATSSSATITHPLAVSSSAPSSTGINIPPAHSSRKKLAPAIGGTLGGLAVIAALILVLLYIRKRNRSQITPSTHSESEHNPTPVFLIDSRFSHRPPYSVSSSAVGQHTVEQSGSASPVSMPTFNIDPQMTPPHIPSQLYPASPTVSTIQDLVASKTHTIAGTGETVPAFATPAANSGPIHGLTEPQVVSIQRLLRQNVPGPLVASVMDSMLRGEGSSSGNMTEVTASVLSGTGTEAPPGYDFRT